MILVPQGAEYKVVKSAAQRSSHPPQVMAIPVGIGALSKWLDQIQWQPGSQIIVMGLCGSLSPQLRAGNSVIYQECVDRSGKIWGCDRPLTEQLQTQLQVPLVRALTSDRIVDSAAEKQQLGITHQAAVVDMEGIAVLSQLDLPVAMVRVVSDDFNQDLPDLSAAIDADGKLQTVPLLFGMIRRPVAAVNLIRGSITGLNQLGSIAEKITHLSI
jgi:hypothetical protein